MLSILRMLGGAILMAPDNDGAGGGDVDDADARAVRNMREKLERRDSAESEPEEERIVVEVGDDRGGDDDDAPRTRQDRRRERGSLHQENERLRAELEAARRPVPPAPPVQQQEPIPTKAEMEDYLNGEFRKLQKEQIELEQGIQAHQKAGTLTESILESAKERQIRLKQNEGVLQRRWAQVQDGSIIQRFQPPQRQVDPVDAQLGAEFSDVVHDQRGAAFAQAYYAKQAASIQLGEREPVSRYELSREAWQAGRAMLQGKTFSRGGGNNGRPAPTRESRARYTGMSSSTGAAGGDRTPTKVTISKEEDSMAQARFAHIPDPAKRRQMFVAERNKKAAQRQRTG